MAPARLRARLTFPGLRGRWGRVHHTFSSRLVVIGCRGGNDRLVLQSVEADRLEAARKQRGERIDVAADAAGASAGRGLHDPDFAIRRKAQKKQEEGSGPVGAS